jgi:hypothetical protein
MARQAAFKIEAWESKAMAHLISEARKHEAYGRGLAAMERAIREAHAEYLRIKAEGGNPIEYMRELGGWSGIAKGAYEAEVGDATSPGSELIGPIRIAGLVDPSQWQRIVANVIDGR